MEVLIPLPALVAAVAGTPAALQDDGAMAGDDAALEAYLHDLSRDKLLLPAPYPELGVDVRVPPPPRDHTFRRLLLLASAVIIDPAVLPAVRLALAAAGPRGPHAIKRLGAVAEQLGTAVDPDLVPADPARAEELGRRVAISFGLTIAGETKEHMAARLAAVDARATVKVAKGNADKQREAEVERAIAFAMDRPHPVKMTPD